MNYKDIEIAQDIEAAANNNRTLEDIVIPALRKANIPQHVFIAKYMGFSLDEVLSNKRLMKRAETNDIGKKQINRWEKLNVKYFTIDDFPPKYRTAPALKPAPEWILNRGKFIGHITEYCGEILFDRIGYLAIIDHMVRNKLFTLDIRDECIEYLNNLCKDGKE